MIVIDEIGVIHSNREFKSMPKECIEWYKMQRKRRLTVIVSSQTMDVDKKIRDLCDRIILCRRYRTHVLATAYTSVIALVQTKDGSQELQQTVKRLGIYRLMSIPRSVRRTEGLGYKTEQIISDHIKR